MIPEVLLYNGFFYVSVVCLFLLMALALRDIARSLFNLIGSFYNKMMFYILFDLEKNSTQENIRIILKYDPLKVLKGDSK